MAAYAYNRRSFGGTPTTLTRVYCRCVALELALKEELSLLSGRGNGGHNVPALLQSFAGAKLASSSPLKSHMSTLSGQLATRLSALWCQDQSGSATQVKAASYPYLRYLRHDSDGWALPRSSNADVQRLESTVNAIWVALKSAGVSL